MQHATYDVKFCGLWKYGRRDLWPASTERIFRLTTLKVSPYEGDFGGWFFKERQNLQVCFVTKIGKLVTVKTMIPKIKALGL